MWIYEEPSGFLVSCAYWSCEQMKNKKQKNALQIQRGKGELFNYIGIVAVLVILLVWILTRPFSPLQVDVSYTGSEAVFIAMSPAETDENWYLHPKSYTKPMEKYPELNAER